MKSATESNHDCVISGAGFAGLTCGLTLAERGFKTLVLEKKGSVDSKLRTTGIIVRDAVDQIALLDELPAGLVRAIPAVRLYAPSLRSICLESPGYYFLATDTAGVMKWLAARVMAAGAEIRVHTPFTGATTTRGGWDLGPLGRCRFLVGADGTHSALARHLDLGRNISLLNGIEYEYPVENPGAALIEPDALHCFVSRKLAPGYIAWVLAGVDHVQAGLARRGTDHRENLKSAMSRFVELVSDRFPIVRQTPVSVRAGPIPCGGLVNPLARNRALLVGDAAGMVSPVTAGGIHTALRYGLAAGHAVADFLEGREPDPAALLVRHYPRFRYKRFLRMCYDNLQADWPFNLMLSTPLMRQIARRLYFHR